MKIKLMVLGLSIACFMQGSQRNISTTSPLVRSKSCNNIDFRLDASSPASSAGLSPEKWPMIFPLDEGNDSMVISPQKVHFASTGVHSPSRDKLDLLEVHDTRKPACGRVVKYEGLISLARSLGFAKSLPKWKSDFYDEIQSKCPEFIYRDLSDKKVQVSVDCLVGLKSLIVREINGKPYRNKAIFETEKVLHQAIKNDDPAIRWFASVTVEEVSPGLYVTNIETPNFPHFDEVSNTCLPARASVQYVGLMHGDFIKKLSPLHPACGE